MEKVTKIITAVKLCSSLAIDTPLLAQDDANTRTSQVVDRNDDDNSGKWGLLGLLGLLGLIEFRKRNVDNKTRVARNP